jgi:hypothetical protein
MPARMGQIMTGLVLGATLTMAGTPGAAQQSSPSAHPTASMPGRSAGDGTPAAVTVTVRTRSEGPCVNDAGCQVAVAITPEGNDAPVASASLDPDAEASDPAASLTVTLAPGEYSVDVSALALSADPPDADGSIPAPFPIGWCARALRLVADQPLVEVVASMAWEQPACGITIDPTPRSTDARTVLTDPVVADGQPPRFRPTGAPTATATANGLRLELWIKDSTLEQGQWLLAHLRVTNVGDQAIAYNGRFEDLDCPPLRFTVDTSAMFDPGLSWTGIADAFKQRFMDEGGLLRASLGIPKRDRGDGCGDIGYRNHLAPGAVVEVPLAGMPAYPLRHQPLPPGTMRVSAAFQARRFDRRDLASVSADVTLAGDPVAYPSPGHLADVALATPGFVDALELSPDPARWFNSSADFWAKPPYPGQPRFDAARDAPKGVLELVQFVGSDVESPFIAGAILDPWTGESFGSYGW